MTNKEQLAFTARISMTLDEIVCLSFLAQGLFRGSDETVDIQAIVGEECFGIA